ncbi:helix-turn-helix transcriptional regulator [Oryzomonas sagensis]|uniref:Helix-turn-helix transcriptional regulator n=1 Tax=Oryzomonas sagensis TaxID=2603857 RepID=A0ABQ6TN76_9BACT|nr:helix-turn-helix transcriptional regulator [Oryzomonas sagensis]KAB0670093.1 helix-turn-helix transcriptional regulator [Oryzomonas sagensis]
MECADLLKVLGERVRAIRKTRKVSQERLAELAGLHPVFISKLETGKAKASICTFYAIATALDMTLAELVELPREGEAWNSDLSELFQAAKRLEQGKQGIFVETVRGLLSGLAG